MFDFNMSDFNVGITMEEIDSMIAEVQKTDVPVIRKTPDMIDKNPDITTREKELLEFTWLHNLYISPMSELAKRICLKLNMPFSEIPSFSNASIMGRMTKLRDFLFSKGCSIDTIVQLLPKSTQEVELLVKAHKFGFDLGFDGIDNLTNDHRLERARNYLMENVINPNHIQIVDVDGKNK